MKPHNIVVTGELKYIKQLIQCISFGPEREIIHKYIGPDRKTEINVPMYFGTLEVDEDHRLDFYGGNSNELFDYINRPSNRDFKGMMVLLNADNKHTLFGFADIITKHINYLRRYALVVAVSGLDYVAVKSAEDQVRECLKELDAVAPVFSIDPKDKKDVSLLVESLLYFASPGINDTSRGKSTFMLRAESEGK